MISSGLDFDNKTKQPKVKNLQIDIAKDSKNDIIKKIKNLNQEDFQKIKTRGDGNCLLRAILKSINENELKFNELRQIISDIIEGSELSEIGDELFKEENCANKSEYVKNIRTDGYYLGGIILEILTKELKIIFGIYLEDERYSADPWKIITPNDEDYKGVVLLNLYQGSSCQTGHYSGIKLFNNHFLGNLNVNSFIKRKPNNEIIMKDKNELNTVI